MESILRFIVYSILVTPPNYKWQEFLERKFPSRTPVHEPSPASSNPPEKQAQQGAQVVPVKDRLNLTNTAAKFVLDQLFGAPLNTLAFLYLMGGMTFQSQAQIWSNIQRVSVFLPLLRLYTSRQTGSPPGGGRERETQSRKLTGQCAGLLAHVNCWISRVADCWSFEFECRAV